MNCCEPIISTFLNETETVIPFPASAQDIYGELPTVKILYLQDGEYIEGTGFITNIKLDDGEIIINHGGEATGIIKIN
jgi:hypothetical protein